MYAQSLAEGHTLQRKELRSQTIREYLEAINLLFTSHSFDAPVDFDDKKSISTNVYDSVKTWESEPNQRTYMAPEVLAALMTKAAAVAQNAPDSLIPVVCDWVLLSRYTGFRLCEYGQKTQTRIEYHTVGHNQKHIMKAMQRSDFRFFDAQGNVITDLINDRDRVVSVEITWRVQKNRQNGQKITWVANEAFPLLCPVQAALRIATRSIRLIFSESGVPLGGYIKTSAKKNKVVYITGNVISDVLRAVAKDVYPHITDSELSQYSAHMLRVSACVLLQQANKADHYIKMRLRWAGESYQVYLRNTPILASQHIDAANLPANAVSLLVAELTALDMGVYTTFTE